MMKLSAFSLIAIFSLFGLADPPARQSAKGTIYLAKLGPQQVLGERDGMRAEGSRWQITALNPNTLETDVVFTLPYTLTSDRQGGLMPGRGLYLNHTDSMPHVPHGVAVSPGGDAVVMFYQRWVQVQRFDGSPATKLLELKHQELSDVTLFWSAVGDEILAQVSDYLPDQPSGQRIRSRVLRCAADASAAPVELKELTERVIDWSRDGKQLLVRQRGEISKFQLLRREGGAAKTLQFGPHAHRAGDHVRLAPDGERLAFTVIDPKRQSGLFVSRLEGNATPELVYDIKHPPTNFWPRQQLAWSPDSRQVALHNRIEHARGEEDRGDSPREVFRHDLLVFDLTTKSQCSVDITKLGEHFYLLAWW